jgi:hypothetical protein
MKQTDRASDKIEKAYDKIGLVEKRDAILVKYRWEFMRRDSKYLEAYKNNESPEPFGIKEMIDPKLSFEDLLHREFLSSLKGVTVMKSPEGETMGFFYNDKAIKRAAWLLGFMDTIEFGSRDERFIDISIDLARVNSIDALKNEINRMVEFYWYLHCKKHDKQTGKVKEFDKILEIGDLRNNDPAVTFLDISQLVFPDDISPESAEKKAQQRYKQYKELTGGGWRLLTTP